MLPRPVPTIRVALRIEDARLRECLTNACGGAGIAVATTSTDSHVDVVLADRPVIAKEISKNNCYYFAGRGCTV
jgi:hypothetical protein